MHVPLDPEIPLLEVHPADICLYAKWRYVQSSTLQFYLETTQIEDQLSKVWYIPTLGYSDSKSQPIMNITICQASF